MVETVENYSCSKFQVSFSNFMKSNEIILSLPGHLSLVVMESGYSGAPSTVDIFHINTEISMHKNIVIITWKVSLYRGYCSYQ